MKEEIKYWLLEQTGARGIDDWEVVQELWNGYGELVRLSLLAAPVGSVILKRVVPPPDARESVSDRRKRRSYQVERTWYERGSILCDEACRVARCLGVRDSEEHLYLLLEDLVDSGFRSTTSPTLEQTRSGLNWLASFHARFLGDKPPGLWEQGSYWHFDTRMDEWHRMPDGPFKEHAETLHHCLRLTQFHTLVHGDPKPPNFLWKGQHSAAAVDFQYVGNGCGIRDVALFLDRGLGRARLRAEEALWLDLYFENLRDAVTRYGIDLNFEALEADWRPRFSVAFSDYARFALGWASHYRPDDYTLELFERALEYCRSSSITPRPKP